MGSRDRCTIGVGALVAGFALAGCSGHGSSAPPELQPLDAAAPLNPSCSLPSGPFGFRRGDTVDPSFSFQAYAPGDAGTKTYTMGDFFDCDGSRGINAIYVEESEQGCIPCENEEMDIEPLMKGSWGADGVTILVLMNRDDKGQIATLATASLVRSAFGLVDVPVGVDPAWVFAETGELSAYPTNVVIDPRTLRVLDKLAGYGAPGSLGQNGDVLWLLSANR